MIRLRLRMVAAAALLLPFAMAASDGSKSMLRAPSDFGAIADENARSVALFQEMGNVILSPRCQNCHPRTDRPNQGDAMTPHNPPVLRGIDGHGVAGLGCGTCHGAANFDFTNGTGSLPGNPKWQLAPLAMAWEGKTLGQICGQIKDPARNGGKSLAALIDHDSHDGLVGWGWNPGRGRSPAPGTQAEFGALTKAWVESGARCPA